MQKARYKRKKVSGALHSAHYTHAAGLGKNKAKHKRIRIHVFIFSPIQSNRDIDHKAFVFFRHQER